MNEYSGLYKKGFISSKYNGIVLAGIATKIYQSTDFGLNFNNKGSYAATAIFDFCDLGNGIIFVQCGGKNSPNQKNGLLVSSDGYNWMGLGNSIFSNFSYDVDWDGTKFVAVGDAGINTIAYSYDGINWIGLGTSIFSTNARYIKYIKRLKLWIALGAPNKMAYSYDGINWNISSNILGGVAPNVGSPSIADNGKLIVISSGGTVNTLAYSYDGINWVGLGKTIFSTAVTVIWGGDKFIAGGGGTNTLAYSYDGINWIGLGLLFDSSSETWAVRWYNKNL
jgi:hypothetical protein